MERLKHMKESLMSCAEGQMGNLQNVNAEELGQVVDMIKDLEEAIYYCTITKEMEEQSKEEKKIERHYYTPYPVYNERDMDYDMGRMYYPQGRDSQGRFTDSQGNSGRRNYSEEMYYGGPTSSYARGGSSGGSSSGRSGNSRNNGGSSSGSSSRSYTEFEFPSEWRDTREGRSPLSRKTYMESKEMHKDKASKIKDLENYMKELSEDIVDMIEDASPEEKQILQQKVSSLSEKISSMSNAKN